MTSKMTQKREYLKRVTVANRIMLLLMEHVMEQDSYSVPEVLSQSGMSEKLSVRQNNLSRDLQSLSAQGLIVSRSAHIRKQQRRKKVYFLSRKGIERSEELASYLNKLYVVVKEGDRKFSEWQLGKVIDLLSKKLHRKVSLHEVVEEVLEGGEADIGRLLGTERRVLASGIPLVKEFYGREGELEVMRTAFGSEGPVMLSMVSIAGQGKTTLASYFISSEELDCSWIKVNRWLTPEKLFSDIASRLGELGYRMQIKDAHADRHTEPFSMVDMLIDGMVSTKMVLVLDDAHLLGNETASILRLLRERSLLRKAPVRWIMASRERPMIYNRWEARSKQDIVEVQLEGLDRKAVSRFLLSKGIPQLFHDDFYGRTTGHPLTIALLTLRPESGPLEVGNAISRLMEDEVISALSQEELSVLEFLSIMDRSVDRELLFSLQGVTRETVAGTISKLLVREYDNGTVDLHDLLTETIRPTISVDKLEKYRRTAYEYFSKRGRDADLVMTIQFARELEMTDAVIRLISDHGEYLLGRGYPQVIDALDIMSDSITDPATRVRMLLLRSDSERLHGNVENAVRLLDEASELAMTVKGMKGVNSQPFLLSRILRRFAEMKDIEESGMEVLDLYLRSLTLVKSSGEKEETAKVYSDTGMAYLGIREFDHAISNLRKALEMYDELGLERGVAQTMTELGIVYFRKLELANSLRELLHAAMISREGGFERTRYTAHYWTGRLYMTVMQPEEAVSYFRSSMTGYARLGDMKNCSRALIGFVSSSTKSGNKRKAERAISRLKKELMGGIRSILPWAKVDLSSEVRAQVVHMDMFSSIIRDRKDILSRDVGRHFDHLRTEYDEGALIDAVTSYAWALSGDFKGPNMDYLKIMEKEAERNKDTRSMVAVLYAKATSTEIDDDVLRSILRKALVLCSKDGFEEGRKKVVSYLSLRSRT
ncbi:MAG: hypothetical protein JW939_05035 [Candidatus Thermoplasmatota archaeon]|nr:hypothetical protein [Candidatus Thermoplasmatota archaeon]